MTIFLTIVHVFVCFVLISVILLQAGRGGGLSDMAGSGQPQAILGTQTNTFMTRATEVCAVLFIITSITLGILSTQRSKSLVEKTKLSRAVQNAVAQTAAPKKQVVEPVKEAVKAAEVTAKAVEVPAVSDTPAATTAPAAAAASSAPVTAETKPAS